MYQRISGPPDLHLAQAVSAFRNGLDVLCDPPLAGSNEDCTLMIEAAQEHQRVLMVAHLLRFRPDYRELKTFVTAGGRGRILAATFIRQAGPPEPIVGGSLLNLLIDPLDQALSLFGLPSRVNCKAFAGPETAMATLVYPGGPEVRIQGGWFPGELAFAESFQVRAEYAELTTFKKSVLINDSTGQRRRLDLPEGDAGQIMLEYFLHCCETHQPPDECPPSASALAVGVALLLKQSREMGGQPLECKV